MTLAISQKIVSQSVVKPTESKPTPEVPAYSRPPVLSSLTYKIKPPTENHAIYVTISYTEHNEIRELFLNTKNPEHFQWMTALSRIISATFRAKVPPPVIIEELKQIHSPTGGYFKTGGKFMPSLLAELGHTIEDAFHTITHSKIKPVESFPASATLCSKCLTKAVIITEGCQTCLSCGDSKCS